MPPVPSSSSTTNRPITWPRSIAECERVRGGRSTTVGGAASEFATSRLITQMIARTTHHRRFRLHHQAAVDVDRAPVEVLALDDELHGEPDILRQTYAADRDRGDQRVARFLVHALRHRRLDHA